MHVKKRLCSSEASSSYLPPTSIYISRPLSSLLQSEATKEAALSALKEEFEAQLESSESHADAKISELKRQLMQVTEHAEQTERERDDRIASMMAELDIKVGGIGRGILLQGDYLHDYIYRYIVGSHRMGIVGGLGSLSTYINI